MRKARLLRSAVALLCAAGLTGCNAIVRPPDYLTADLRHDGLFITAGDGDWNQYEPLGHFEYYNMGTRWWFPLGFVYAFPIERVSVDEAIREHLVPAIRQLGGDGAIAMETLHIPSSWASPLLFILVGESALGSAGHLRMRATIVKRWPEAAAAEGGTKARP